MCAYRWMAGSFALALGLLAGSLSGQEPGSDEEAARLQKVADRFVTVLEKNPRRGTALDKVYGFHVENGSLEPFVQSYRDRTAKDAKDGVAWMVLGLLESLRGRDAVAVEAFTRAAEAMP